jgi:hypothetical protein
MAPLAILVVYGLGGIFSDSKHNLLLTQLNNKSSLSSNDLKKKVFISQKKRQAHFFTLIVLLILLSSSIYVAHRSLNVSIEEITSQDLNALMWLDENLDKNTTMIASDHRLCRMVEAYGFNTTKDQTIKIWEALELNEYIDELYGIGKNHSKITHIIIDDKMKYDVVHFSSYVYFFMFNETNSEETKWAAYDKFKKQPFELLYKNESEEKILETEESIHWAEVYKINWTYINNYIWTRD